MKNDRQEKLIEKLDKCREDIRSFQSDLSKKQNQIDQSEKRFKGFILVIFVFPIVVQFVTVIFGWNSPFPYPFSLPYFAALVVVAFFWMRTIRNQNIELKASYSQGQTKCEAIISSLDSIK